MAYARHRRTTRRAFDQYLSPWIIRGAWSSAVVLAIALPVVTAIALEHQGLVNSHPLRALAWFVASLVASIMYLLMTRLALETIAVIFDIRAELVDARIARGTE